MQAKRKPIINVLVKDEHRIDTDEMRKVGLTNGQTRKPKYVIVRSPCPGRTQKLFINFLLGRAFASSQL